MTEHDRLMRRFAEDRGRRMALAYRMLGSAVMRRTRCRRRGCGSAGPTAVRWRIRPDG